MSLASLVFFLAAAETFSFRCEQQQPGTLCVVQNSTFEWDAEEDSLHLLQTLLGLNLKAEVNSDGELHSPLLQKEHKVGLNSSSESRNIKLKTNVSDEKRSMVLEFGVSTEHQHKHDNGEIWIMPGLNRTGGANVTLARENIGKGMLKPNKALSGDNKDLTIQRQTVPLVSFLTTAAKLPGLSNSEMLVTLAFLAVAAFIVVCLFARKQNPLTEAELEARRAAKRMPTLRPGSVQMKLPAMCHKILASNSDVPFLVPAKALFMNRAGLVHSFNICCQRNLSIQLGKVIFVNELDSPEALVSIDMGLVIRGANGTEFGRLARLNETEYTLQESNGRPSRMVFRINWDHYSVEVIYKDTGALLATAKINQHSMYEVMTATGVDAVLTLACILGLVTFIVSPHVEQSAIQEAMVEAEQPEMTPAEKLLDAHASR